MVTNYGSLVIYVPIWMPLTRENHPIPQQGDLNTRVDASRDDVDAWLAAKSGAPEDRETCSVKRRTGELSGMQLIDFDRYFMDMSDIFLIVELYHDNIYGTWWWTDFTIFSLGF